MCDGRERQGQRRENIMIYRVEERICSRFLIILIIFVTYNRTTITR